MKYKIIIPQEKSKEEVCNCGLKKSKHNVRHPFVLKKETLEEAAERYFKELSPHISFLKAVKFGAKWQAERMYSEEDMKQFGLYLGDNFKKLKNKSIDEIFEQFKKK